MSDPGPEYFIMWPIGCGIIAVALIILALIFGYFAGKCF